MGCNAKIFQKAVDENSDKEFTDSNETISITIANKFQPLNESNESSTSVERTAEIKRFGNHGN